MERIKADALEPLRNQCRMAMAYPNNLTQGELAKRLGITDSKLSLILHGKQSISINTLIRFREVLDCSFDDLLGRRR